MSGSPSSSGSPAEDRAPLGKVQRGGENRSAVGTGSRFGEDGADGRYRLFGKQTHHPDRRPAIEDGEENRLLVHGRDVNVFLDSLVEEHRELGFAEESGHGRGGAERTRRERGQGHGVEGTVASAFGEELASPIDQECVRGTGLVEEGPEHVLNLPGGILVNGDIVRAHDVPSSRANPLINTILDTVFSVSNTPAPPTATASNVGTRRVPWFNRNSR